jgi:hypothetical protein
MVTNGAPGRHCCCGQAARFLSPRRIISFALELDILSVFWVRTIAHALHVIVIEVVLIGQYTCGKGVRTMRTLSLCATKVCRSQKLMKK